MSYYLIADVGGTNIRLAIARSYEEDYFLLQTYKCKKFSSINEAIKHYLKDIPVEFYPKSGAIAVAATILFNEVDMTNNNWRFSIKDLQADLGFDSLQVINDFEAQAYALEYLKKEDYATIKEQQIISSNINKRIITGPGTGLGTCVLLKPQTEWLIIPSEAGHTNMGYSNKEEQSIYDYYIKSNNRIPYAEEFLSGRGLVNIYKALAYKYRYKVIEDILPKTIVEKAFITNDTVVIDDKDDIIAKKFKHNIYLATVDIFCNLMGTYISNIALMFLPQQIYLTGGILPKMIDYLQNGDFKDRFLLNQIDNVQMILHNTAIYLITKENPAMLGMARYIINHNKN